MIFEQNITLEINPNENNNCDKYGMWIDNNRNSYQEVARQEPKTEPVTFHNLTGGSQYNFSVIAIAGNFNSTALEFQSYTSE